MKLKLAILLLAVLLLLTACSETVSPSAPQPEETPGEVTPGTDENKEDDSMKNPIVTITMDGGGVIKAELYPDKAPNTVANFVSLIQAGFYDGLIFHRTSPVFMIQGGDPNGDGSGGPGYSIFGEFADNGFEQNDISHERGVLSMARRSFPLNSAGSQFFIMTSDSFGLDGGYAAFGRVTEGLDVVDSIASGPNTGGQEMRALEPRTMVTVTVETFGIDYQPETIRGG
jgi:peptidyl-prolyl cis-trans isomerase B (cyclophilin B)